MNFNDDINIGKLSLDELLCKHDLDLKTIRIFEEVL